MAAHEPTNVTGGEISRREFNAGVTGIAALSLATADVVEGVPRQEGGAVPLSLNINGQPHQLSLDPRVTLLDLLRERLALTGTKKGCDHGQCGACTVLLNGQRVLSCLTLAAKLDGETVTTVEGLSPAGELHPMQRAFIDFDGFQCGYCTPGQICSAIAAIEEARAGVPSLATRNLRTPGAIPLNEDEIRERMSGNICRCGAYPNIVAAVRYVSETGKPA